MKAQRVVILGGGVAGMSAAHELIERGFEVVVLARRDIAGGKARSIPVSDSEDGGAGHELADRGVAALEHELPGEHGFRFFPGFYKHVTDTMRRTPYGSHGNAFQNLSVATRTLLARAGRAEITWLARRPENLEDLRVFLIELFTPLGVPPLEIAYFVNRLLILATSCTERRFAEYEKIKWWDFIDAARMSRDYQAYF